MKNIIRNYLIKWKIITKFGYINPIILIGFLICTPAYFVIIGQVKKDKYYLTDEEIAALIMNEGGKEEIVSDTIYIEETIKKIVKEEEVEDKPKNVKTSSFISKSDFLLKEKKTNLTLLLQKAKHSSRTLSKWDMFRLKVYQSARNLKHRYPNIDGSDEDIYNWSMKTFHQESRYRENAKNPHSSAKYIFQAMYSTRESLGMPHKNVPLLKQVEYYEKYICMMIDGQRLKTENLNTALDWYLITFYPALSDDSDNVNFASCYGYNKSACRNKRGWKSCNYHANIGYDLNRDAKITKKEIGEHLLKSK